MAIAILFTAYTSAINGKHYGLAAALSTAGLGLTTLGAAAVLAQATAASLAQPGLIELQHRIAGRLRIHPIRTAPFQGRTRGRRGVAVTFGLAALLQISGLLYALTH